MRESTERTQRTNNSNALVIATWFGFTNRAWITSGLALMPTPTPAIAMNLCAVEIGRRDTQIHGEATHPFTWACMLRCMAIAIRPTPTVMITFPSTMG